MIARINKGSSPGGAVRYNESKVVNGEAKLLSISNYPVSDPLALSITEKVQVLEEQVFLNTKVSEPVIHIALALG